MKHHVTGIILVSGLALAGVAQASWLSKITGMDIDLNRGTVSIGPPDIGAIPGMIQNLPKDAGQALLNPLAPTVATAIRFSRGQALNRGAKPMPVEIRRALTPYFPDKILSRARWTTADGLSIDGMLKNWFDQEGAITYDEVIVFTSTRHAQDVQLWAHELTHSMQYAQMGVETFAFQYTYDWNSLEKQARDNAGRIYASYQSTEQGAAPTWALEGELAQPSQQPTWQAMNQAAKLAIPPEQCIWINNQTNMTGNVCPVAIRVAEVVMMNLADRTTFRYPCNQPTCIFQPGQSGPLLSPYGHVIVGVTAAYQH